MRLAGVVCVLLVAARWSSGAAAREKLDGPMQAVWAMLEGFATRSETAYVARMADDFQFDSDSPSYRDSFPGGMDRTAEEQFARRLFRGGRMSPGGRPLPTATRVELSVGPVSANAEAMPDGQQHVTLEHLAVRIALSDGSVLEVGETRNELWLVRTPSGWRVHRWRETHPTLAALDSATQQLVQAAGMRDRPAAADVAQARLAPGVRPRVVLAPRKFRARARLRFGGALPGAGGALELCDEMRRRLLLRDLSDLAAGQYVVP